MALTHRYSLDYLNERHQQLEREHSLSLTRNAASIFMILLSCIFVVATVYLYNKKGIDYRYYLGYEIIGVCIAVFTIGYRAARAGKLRFARNCVAIASSVAIISLYAGWFLLQRERLDGLLLTGLATFDLIILFIGLVGAERSVLVTTLLLNICSFGFLLSGHLDQYTMHDLGVQWWVLLPQVLLQQWVIAALFIITIHFRAENLSDLISSYKDVKDRETELRHFVHDLKTRVRLLDTALKGNEEAFPSHVYSKFDCLIEYMGDRLDMPPLYDHKLEELEPILLKHSIDLAIEVTNLRERICISCDPTLEVKGTKNHLQVILVNVLQNAEKYSKPEEPLAPIEITAYTLQGDPCQPEEKYVVVAIRDDGIGIPADELQRIFDDGYRGTNVTDEEGSGSGLYICRSCANLMKGELHAESAGPGAGSTLYLHLKQAL